jgi:Dolichyl-phosphate-mannose-protein mannosyltransferase
VSSASPTICDPMAPSKQGSRAAEALLLGSSVLSLVFSCVLWSSRKQAWMDEIFTWKEASDPSLWHLYRAIQHGADGGQPLFYTTVWLWQKAFGGGILTLRLYSCAAMCGALWITWKTIRRYYGMWATAFGVLAIWGTSSLLLDQNAEARFYGLYMLTVAIAVACYARLTEQATPKRSLLVGTLLAQSALVLAHVLGLVYSGLILLALVLFDGRRRRFRWKVYLFHAAGWLALLVWLPAIRASMAAGRPHGWIPMPGLRQVLDAYTFGDFLEWLAVLGSHTQGIAFVLARHLAQFFIVVPMAIVITLIAKRFLSGKGQSDGDARDALLLVAFILLSAPLLLYALSHLFTPVFVPRYILPSGIGMAILLTAFAEAAGADRRRSPSRILLPKNLWPTLAAILLICPVSSALVARTSFAIATALDVDGLASHIPPDTPVVIGWQQDFVRLMRYSRAPQSRYYFLLDWPAALVGAPGAVLEYHLMQAYRNVGYYAPNIQVRNAFLCAHPDFFVLDARESSWADLVIPKLPELQWKAVETFFAPEVKRTLYAVHRKAPLPFCTQQ